MKKLFSVLKYFLFLGIGILLFWLVYRDQPIVQLIEEIKNANYNWILLAMVIALMGHLSRGMRWGLLIEPLGKKVKPARTFMAVMIGYMANLAFPRMGEITRCVTLNRTEKIPFNKLLGTVIVERGIDFIMLMSLTIISVLIEFGKIKDTVYNSYFYYRDKYELLFSFYTLGIVVLILAGGIYFLYRIKKSKRGFKQHPLYLKVREIISGFWSGIKTIKHMEKKGAFIFHSIFIWVTYFFMTYLVFFSVEGTSNLGMRAGLFVLTIGSLGFIMPVQGGVGTYHFAAEKALKVFSIDHDTASLYALIGHTSQTLMLIVIGGLSFLYFVYLQRKLKHAELDKK